MVRRWTILLVLGAVAGCEPDPDSTSASQRPSYDRLASFNARASRLKLEVGERDLRIRELETHVERLSQKLQSLEFTNEQLRKQLTVVGEAPAERDRYRRMAAQQALQIHRLQTRMDELMKRVKQIQPTTQPADQTPAGQR